MDSKKKELLKRLIEEARAFRLCGPSDDPDEQSAVTSGYHYLVVQFQNLAGPILPENLSSRLQSVEVDFDNLNTVRAAKAQIDSLLPDIETALDQDPLSARETRPSANPLKIFVVHGRDDRLRRELFHFLRALGLTPIEWAEAIKLTGKGSPYIGEILDSAFGHAQAIVVLLTPDDEVRLSPDLVLASDSPDEREHRLQARPNVLFEAGLAFGRNPDRTILVEVGSPKPFSDVAGRHTVRLSDEESRRRDLMERLKTAGCSVKPTNDDWLRTGNFEVSRSFVPGEVMSQAGSVGVDTEPSVKWVDLNYPVDSGLQKELLSEGYEIKWCLDSNLARKLDIEGWSLVTQRSKTGREVILKVKDRPADQTLIKKKISDGPTPEEIQSRVDQANVSAKIIQGYANSFVLMLTNESEETVIVKQIRLFGPKDIALTEPYMLPPEAQRTIDPKGRLEVRCNWQSNPANAVTNFYSPDGWQNSTSLERAELTIEVGCEILKKFKRCPTKKIVQVDFLNHRIDDFLM